MTTYSSRGPTRCFWSDSDGTKHYDNLVKHDLVAPGNKLVAAQAAGNYLVTNNPSLDAGANKSPAKRQMTLSGTSMAAPVVACATALLVQANPSLTPNLIKSILMYTAQSLAGFSHFEQGAGQINLEGAVRLTKAMRTDISYASLPLGAPLLCHNCKFPLPQTNIAGHTFT